MTKIMVETPIAFGLTMVVCLALFFYCWRIRKIRNRLTSVQVSATPVEVQSEDQTGLKKEVINTFPTVRTHELRVDVKEELQCPICLIEYGDAEVLRKLPICGHVFHIRCVDSWLENQVTCPVCRIVLAEVAKLSSDTIRQQASSYRRGASMPNSVIVEVAAGVPAWVLVNRPMPLPPAIPERTSVDSTVSDFKHLGIELFQPSRNSGSNGEAPLLELHTAGWGAIYLEKNHDGLNYRSRTPDIAIETKECVSHSSISERWMTESFSFGMSTCDDGSSTGMGGSIATQSHNHWRSDSSNPHANSWTARSVTSSWDSDQPTIKHWQADFGHPAEEVFESKVMTHHLPLTISPEHCSFEFLPIITGPGGDYSWRPPAGRVGLGRHSYS